MTTLVDEATAPTPTVRDDGATDLRDIDFGKRTVSEPLEPDEGTDDDD